MDLDTATSSHAGEQQHDPASVPIVVGIGASAGGLEAFTQLLEALPLDTGMGFVLFQHLAPDRPSALSEILSRVTALPVREIQQDDAVKANHVYVVPHDASLTIVQGRLRLQERLPNIEPHRPIDAFFESLAQDRRNQAIGIVLSGTASDGALGLEAIKAEGGFTFAQDESAKFDSMPRSAVAAGCVDLVLAPTEIAKELARMAKHPFVVADLFVPPAVPEQDHSDALVNASDNKALPSGGKGAPETGADRAHAEAAGTSPNDTDESFQLILSILRSHAGVDFSLYKSATIQRRIARRLVLNNQTSLDDYATFLKGNTVELDALYSDVLICVTSFFRNPETFDFLELEVLPKLLAQKADRDADDPIRVWVLGCSTGQEAYSIAMAFVEAMEKGQHVRKVQIFATDLNEALLAKARQGLYVKTLAQDISPKRLQRFFSEEQGGYRISKAIREMVVFARQNIIADPPFSRMDIISCRNLLIYLEPSLQHKAIPTFHYALRPGGLLLLGASESIGDFSHLFEIVDKRHKIFTRKSAATLYSLPVKQLPPSSERHRGVSTRYPLAVHEHAIGSELSAQREADRITVNQFGPPAVLVGPDLQVLQFRGPTGPFLEAPTGAATFDVLKMARAGLMLPLRGVIDQARNENKPARIQNVRVERNGQTARVNVEVIPLKNLRENNMLILFEDAEKPNLSAVRLVAQETQKQVSPDLLDTNQQFDRIAELEADLAEAREYLRLTQAQHEYNTEELRTASEEIQSANEELQSVNEELETSKEELQSTNEELTTVNEEMAHRNAELLMLNNDLVNLETSTKLGIVLLGRNLCIRRFSAQAESQFSFVQGDVGRPIGHIRTAFVVGDGVGTPFDFETVSTQVIANLQEQEHEVQDPGGNWSLVRVRPYKGVEGKIEGVVIVVTDITALKSSDQTSRQSEARFRAMFESTSVGVSESSVETGRIERVNDEFARILGCSPGDLIGKVFVDLVFPDSSPDENHGYGRLLSGELPSYEIEKELVRPDGTKVWAHTTINVVHDGAARPLNTVAITYDISERKRAEEALRESRDSTAFLAEIVRSSYDAILTESLDGNITSWNRAAERTFGYSVDDVLGKLSTLLLPEGFRADEAPPPAALPDGAVRESYETLRRRKDGSVVEVSLTVSPVKNKEGRVIGLSKIARDITESKRSVLELRKQATDLAGVDRRKDEFIAMFGHELRNPLAALVHGLGLLEKEKDDPARSQELRGLMTRQTTRIGHLVDQLLDLARVALGTVDLASTLVDLAEIVTAASETVSSLVESRQHSLLLSLPEPQNALVIGDAIRLTQVLENLLTNSAKYTDEHGEIRVSVTSNNENVIIIVSDTGIGMSADFLPHAFDAFSQAPRALDRSKGGLGIGLNFAQRLVKMHGGNISAKSAGFGKGTEITITLPRAFERRARVRTQPPDASTAATNRSYRILVVDDEEDVGEPFAELLAADGHITRAVTDGPSALAAMATFDPEVVLLDLGLPVMDGYAVAKKLREEYPSKKILLVAVTGYHRDSARIQDAGFNQHLIKPPDMNKLSAMLSAWNQT